jgi:urocanate hydratase
MLITAGSSPTAIITNSSTLINLYQQNGSYTALDNTNFVANCQVTVSGFYFI